MALEAQNSATLEDESLRSAMCPPSLRFCSSLDIVFIWNVTFSSHAWRPSHCLAISPILCWIAWCSMRNLPKVRLDRANAMDSSTQVLAILAACAARSHLSWLKLYMICLNPSPTLPTTFFLGTLTLSNSM